MDHIDSLTFTPGHQMGLWCAHDELKRIKETVGGVLHIGYEQLNEIALEDIEVERNAQQRIFNMLYELTVVAEISGDTKSPRIENQGVPCTGFWIETTLELVLHAWNDYQAKTIVIPPSEWFLREDIIVH